MTEMQMQDADDTQAFSFGRRFVRSEAFMLLFREGMGLVERTAAYLDGDGRAASAALPREIALCYATESMRLTTRLMQIASWLLVQRAVAEGEMTVEQAQLEKNKVKLAETMMAEPRPEAELLPDGLLELMAHSLRVQERIRHLDGLMSGGAREAVPDNPVRSQLATLHERLGLTG